MRIHKRENLPHIVVPDSTEVHANIDVNVYVDPSHILNAFSSLLNECRSSIPLTRII